MKRNYYFLITLILLVTFFYIPRANAYTGFGHNLVRIFASDATETPLRIIGNIFEKEHPQTHISYDFTAPGAFYLLNIKGDVLPPDIYITSDEKYQNDVMELADINSYKVFAYNHLVAVTPFNNPAGVNASNLISKLMDKNVSLAVASPKLSPAGEYTMNMFRAINKNTPGAFNEIVGHAKQLLDPALVMSLLKNRKTDIGIIYASQAVELQREGVRINVIPIPMKYNTKAVFAISVFKKFTGHLVTPRKARHTKEIEALLLSKRGQMILKAWGFSPVK